MSGNARSTSSCTPTPQGWVRRRKPVHAGPGISWPTEQPVASFETVNSAHQSDSAVQRGAESAIIDALADELKVPLIRGGYVTLGGGAKIQLDARSDDGKIVVEAYARQGKLKGGQLKKVAQDVLKLALVRKQPEYLDAQAIVVFASEEALSSVSGWVKDAAREFGVELRAVEIEEELRQQIVAAQDLQKMVNAIVPLDEGAN